MLDRCRRRLAADHGMSLVEMLVAMTLLAVVLSAGASTLISSFTALAANENRTRATALANEELENLRALPWQELGFYEGDTFPSGLRTDDTVILGDGGSRPAGSRAPRPRDVVTGRGPDYTVTRTIEWVDNEATSSSDPSAPSDEDFKRLTVNVAWVDASGAARAIDVASTRSPTAAEQPASDFVLSLYDVQPGIVHLNEDGSIASGETLQLSALTSAEATFLEVEFDELGDDPPRRWPLITPGDGITWNGSYSSGRFPNGEVVFLFRATRSWPVEQEVIGRRIVRFLRPPGFTAFTLTPASPTTCLAPDAPTPEVQVDVHVSGITEEDPVEVSWNGHTLEAKAVGISEAGTWFRATIPAGSYTASGPVTATAWQQAHQFSTDPAGQLVVTRMGDPGCAS